MWPHRYMRNENKMVALPLPSKIRALFAATQVPVLQGAKQVAFQCQHGPPKAPWLVSLEQS